MGTDRLTFLRSELDEARTRATALSELAELENRDFTAAELEDVAAYSATIDQLSGQIEAHQRLASVTAEPDDSAPAPTRRTMPAVARDPVRDARCGFRNVGEFAQSVYMACRPGGQMDNRLARMQPDPSNITTDAEGGFAVPPDFRQAIVKKIQGETSLLSLTDQYQTAYNTITVPKDETTPWQTSGGLLANWVAEEAAITESKITIAQQVVSLDKMAVLAPVTEELLSDSPMIASYINNKVPDKMVSLLNTAIIAGTGSGQPDGITGHAATLAIARSGANQVNFADITGMWAAMYPPSKSRAVWVCSSEVEALLMQMSFRDETTSPVPVYIPGNSLAGSPYAMLLGRPLIVTEAAAALNAPGDITLWDTTGYFSVVKAGGGIRSDVSIHFYFSQDISCLRVIFRVGGMPWLDGPITSGTGGSYGQFVQLAAGA